MTGGDDCKIKHSMCLQDLENVPIQELSHATFYGGESHWIKPSITTDLGANVSCGVEMHNIWDWGRCACHVLHMAV